jgi:uncharacterized membrane-anchored protein
MKKPLLFSMAAIFSLAMIRALAEETNSNPIQWSHGPVTAEVGNVASIYIPERYLYLGDSKEIEKERVRTHNLYDSGDVFELAPVEILSVPSSWNLIFSYATGFVKENTNNTIDKDGLLATAKNDQEKENIERKAKGFVTYVINGWAVEPHFDENTKNLEWAYDLTWVDPKNGKNFKTINYFTKYLGQHGVMTIQLVTMEESFKNDLIRFREILGTFRFNLENEYNPATANPTEVINTSFNEQINPNYVIKEKPAVKAKSTAIPTASPTEAPTIPTTLVNTTRPTEGTGGWPWWIWVLLLLAGSMTIRQMTRTKSGENKRSL